MRDEWRIKVSNSLLSYYLPLVFRTKLKATAEMKHRKKYGFMSGSEAMKVVLTRVIEVK